MTVRLAAKAHGSELRDHLPELPRGSELRDLNTIEEAAEWSRLPVDTLYAFRSRGQGPKATKLGRRLVYTREALLAWFDEQAAKSA